MCGVVLPFRLRTEKKQKNLRKEFMMMLKVFDYKMKNITDGFSLKASNNLTI